MAGLWSLGAQSERRTDGGRSARKRTTDEPRDADRALSHAMLDRSEREWRALLPGGLGPSTIFALWTFFLEGALFSAGLAISVVALRLGGASTLDGSSVQQELASLR